MTDASDATGITHTAWLLLVGNELLSGKVTDSNGTHAIAALRARGIDLLGVEIVPDGVDRISEAIQRAANDLRPSVIITSGGVGPTHDDVTLEAVAKACGRVLEQDDDLAQRIRDHWRTHFTDDLLRMACVPHGGELVYEEGDFFPLFRVDNIWCLPGDPGFFRKKFDYLMGLLTPPGPFVVRRVHTSCGEQDLATLLRELQAQYLDVAIGSYPKYDEAGGAWWTLITLDARDATRADDLLEKLLAGLPDGSVKRVDRK